jgi:pyruvate/2-oxoglutarate dehydrogenase complex dihydrolipoamide acyltransferase (E2) component
MPSSTFVALAFGPNVGATAFPNPEVRRRSQQTIMHGVDTGTPILPPGEAAILAFGPPSTEFRPLAVSGHVRQEPRNVGAGAARTRDLCRAQRSLFR